MAEPRFRHEPIIHRRKLEMPEGARVAVWVGINVEYYDFNKPGPSLFAYRGPQTMFPNPRDYGWFAYGLRVGIWRIMDILDQRNMRGSVLLNSDMCKYHPEIIEEGNLRKWVWLAHGRQNGIPEHGFEYHEELEYLAEVVSSIEAGTGTRPKGWLGPGLGESLNTLDILADLGLTYVCDWCADDQPFELAVRTGKMINVPYAIDGLNDVRLRDLGYTGDDYYDLIIDQFEQLHEDGESNPRVMCLAIHPYLTGQPFRARKFAAALTKIRETPNVWLPTSDEIASWYYDSYYRETPFNQ